MGPRNKARKREHQEARHRHFEFQGRSTRSRIMRGNSERNPSKPNDKKHQFNHDPSNYQNGNCEVGAEKDYTGHEKRRRRPVPF